MNRPDNMLVYDEIDLKLGIKSSLPHIKSTLALAVLLWECSDHPSELIYSQSNGDEIVISDKASQCLIDYLDDICVDEQIDSVSLINKINQNQLFKSQIEALIVAFELVWKIARVNFVESEKPTSAERTGGKRFPKKLNYSINIDIIHSVITSNETSYKRILMSWLGFNIYYDIEFEMTLAKLFTALSESAVFKLTDGDKDVVFNQDSIYRKIIEKNEVVNINGDKESKGSLRILKSFLSDNLNPYLEYNNGNVFVSENDTKLLDEYQRRVDTFLRLSATKVIGMDNINAINEDTNISALEAERLSTGANILLYGVPGSGKSWTIEHEYCDNEDCIERLVFHPDYMYSDFVGQILPVIKDDDKVRYEFTPGPFIKLLKRAYYNPDKSYYLIIEEINRGNAPAIFGEIFQLLDRKDEDEFDKTGKLMYKKGTSEYGITNANIARAVYGNEEQKIRIPSNMSILGTMNTSDQNVFTLDTAFQRRWIMRMIKNSFENHKFADEPILDTKVSWKQFCEAINDEILRRNNITSSEDKRLGAYFISASDLKMKSISEDMSEKERIQIEHDNNRFAEKVLKYLWDDAFKFSHQDTFNTRQFDSLEKVIAGFMDSSKTENQRFRVFNENLRKMILEGVTAEPNEVSDEDEIIQES